MHTLAHCCYAGYCCAPGTEEQIASLAAGLEADLGLSAYEDSERTGIGRSVAEWIDANDMALVPKPIALAIHEAHAEALKLKKHA